ncbi:phage-related integrase [Xanthomonas fragariae]|uniref:Phage-related integrase n=1 Tax=Xanthomonas fragariae TaxID=48664 RepID=A0A1Y6HEW4_9XANT|nr:hypothetical protein [Xanthomonas fragariae]MBL9197456.1 hypothetical protein [Xanthomonas fragariae]MBL9222593.1 hypothetical protein [Xanthomonas fragariae]SMQ93695.1 phage-related integrase [Xanthomonas fragariae]SMR00810.1 hypothetical protein PD885_03589 [Xanthomonas fragariae]SMR01740.1 phage-related integrase [Xanthomonas fragariae]
MARGRKRKFNPAIPAHIEQEAVPKSMYWDNGCWYMLEDHPAASTLDRTTNGCEVVQAT